MGAIQLQSDSMYIKPIPSHLEKHYSKRGGPRPHVMHRRSAEDFKKYLQFDSDEGTSLITLLLPSLVTLLTLSPHLPINLNPKLCFEKCSPCTNPPPSSTPYHPKLILAAIKAWIVNNHRKCAKLSIKHRFQFEILNQNYFLSDLKEAKSPSPPKYETRATKRDSGSPLYIEALFVADQYFIKSKTDAATEKELLTIAYIVSSEEHE